MKERHSFTNSPFECLSNGVLWTWWHLVWINK